MPEDIEQAEGEAVKVEHRRAPTFNSAFATGTILSALGNGFYNLTFYEDCVGVEKETMTINPDGSTVSSFGPGDLFPHKEDKIRITMHHKDLMALYTLMKSKLDVAEGHQTEAEND